MIHNEHANYRQVQENRFPLGRIVSILLGVLEFQNRIEFVDHVNAILGSRPEINRSRACFALTFSQFENARKVHGRPFGT